MLETPSSLGWFSVVVGTWLRILGPIYIILFWLIETLKTGFLELKYCNQRSSKAKIIFLFIW